MSYNTPDHSTAGKSSEHIDIVSGRFIEIVPDKRIVQAVNFESEDAAFDGTMIMTWSLAEVPSSLAEVPSGTRVTISWENVPYGISKEDHDEGLKPTLDNLANYLE